MLSALAPGITCKPITVAEVGGKKYNPEATGNAVANASQTGASQTVTVVPSTSSGATQACTYTIAPSSAVNVRFGSPETSVALSGSFDLADLQVAPNGKSALPTNFKMKISISGVDASLALDKTSPYNQLLTGPDGTGTLSVALTLDSKSSALSSCVFMGGTYYFTFPVQVSENFNSVTLNFNRATPGSTYTPVDPLLLVAADEPLPPRITNTPCNEDDGNGLRDGAEEVIGAMMSQLEDYGTQSTHRYTKHPSALNRLLNPTNILLQNSKHTGWKPVPRWLVPRPSKFRFQEPACIGDRFTRDRRRVQLPAQHLPVPTFLAGKLLVRADFDDASVLHHHNLIGMTNRAQPVGDDEACAPLHQPLQRFLDHRLALAVEVAGRFIEDEYARISEQRTGDGDALLLPTREPHTTLADESFIPALELADEPIGVGRPRSADQLLIGCATARIANVLADCAIKEKYILLNNPKQSPVRVHIDGAKVNTIKLDSALCPARVVKAGDQVAQGGLARSTRADKGDGLPRRDFNVDVAEHILLVPRISEINMPKTDPTINTSRIKLHTTLPPRSFEG